MSEERITREVTPMVDALGGPITRVRLIAQNEAGALFEEDGRVVFKMLGPGGRPSAVLVDPDVDLWDLVTGTSTDLLHRLFEVHLPHIPSAPIPRELRGMTVVIPHETQEVPPQPGISFAVKVAADAPSVPQRAVELHLSLTPEEEELPTRWPDTEIPMVMIMDLSHPATMDLLPQLAHGMGTGRYPVREIRLRVDPKKFKAAERRTPFLSEVVGAIANSVGCSSHQLCREMALRQRMVPRGLRRHLLPDPYFVTWTFRAHASRGLIPATDHFPVPRRPSRQEILRGTPESERERLLEYLALLEDPQPRAHAIAQRGLFAVSVHYLPNKDLPLLPDHGGIVRLDGENLLPLR